MFSPTIGEIVGIVIGNVLVAALIAGAAHLSKRLQRPALTHALYLLVLVKLVTPPIWRMPMPRFDATPEAEIAAISEIPDEMIESATLPAGFESLSGPSAASNHPSAFAAGSTIEKRPAAMDLSAPESDEAVAKGLRGGIAAAWAVGVLAVLLLAAARTHRFHRLVRHGRPADAVIQRIADDTARAVGLERIPPIIVVPAVVPPLLWARGGRPVIILPESLAQKLSEDALRSLIAHELAHFARRDHWVRYFELAATALYWWLPPIALIRRELRRAEEECCDAWVVGCLPETAEEYAHALLATVDFCADHHAPLPAAASGVGAFDTLKRRLSMILIGSSPYRLNGIGRTLLAIVALATLPLVPAFGQEDERFPETRKFLRSLETRRDAAAQNGDDEQAMSLDREIRALRAFLDQKKKSRASAQKPRAEEAPAELPSKTEPSFAAVERESAVARNAEAARGAANRLLAERKYDEAKLRADADRAAQDQVRKYQTEIRRLTEQRAQMTDQLRKQAAAEEREVTAQRRSMAQDYRKAVEALKAEAAAQTRAMQKQETDISRKATEVESRLKEVESKARNAPSPELDQERESLQRAIDDLNAAAEDLRQRADELRCEAESRKDSLESDYRAREEEIQCRLEDMRRQIADQTAATESEMNERRLELERAAEEYRVRAAEMADRARAEADEAERYRAQEREKVELDRVRQRDEALRKADADRGADQRKVRERATEERRVREDRRSKKRTTESEQKKIVRLEDAAVEVTPGAPGAPAAPGTGSLNRTDAFGGSSASSTDAFGDTGSGLSVSTADSGKVSGTFSSGAADQAPNSAFGGQTGASSPFGSTGGGIGGGSGAGMGSGAGSVKTDATKAQTMEKNAEAMKLIEAERAKARAKAAEADQRAADANARADQAKKKQVKL